MPQNARFHSTSHSPCSANKGLAVTDKPIDQDDTQPTEPHLLDLGDPVAVAQWVSLTIMAAGIGLATQEGLKLAASKVKDVLQRLRKDKGRSEVTKVKGTVILLLDRKRDAASDAGPIDLTAADVDEIFREYE